MKKNFHLGQSNEIVVGQNVYDIHNDYCIEEVVYNNKTSVLKLIFMPNDRDEELSIIFEKIRFLEIKKLDEKEKLYVEEMGYKDCGDNDDEWLLTENQSSEKSHLFLRLQNDDYIRVYAESAQLRL